MAIVHPAGQGSNVPHVVIIGAGFGGLQAALALGKQPVRVTVIDRTNHHLFQPLLYQVATAALSPADISVPIRLSTCMVIWTAGVQATPVGKWLGTETDRSGRVRVEEDLSVPGHPNVFVIGDAAGLTQNGKPLPAVAPVAMQEGRYVAALISQRLTDQSAGTPFHYQNRGNMATVGRAYAITDLGFIRFSGFIAWVLWLAIHSMYLIGFENRVIVMLQWIWSYLRFERRARIISIDTGMAATNRRSRRKEAQGEPAGEAIVPVK
jgi:NADH dehydrogenase FAD-containing subunit